MMATLDQRRWHWRREHARHERRCICLLDRKTPLEDCPLCLGEGQPFKALWAAYVAGRWDKRNGDEEIEALHGRYGVRIPRAAPDKGMTKYPPGRK